MPLESCHIVNGCLASFTKATESICFLKVQATFYYEEGLTAQCILFPPNFFLDFPANLGGFLDL